jgi:hypothetical protein
MHHRESHQKNTAGQLLEPDLLINNSLGDINHLKNIRMKNKAIGLQSNDSINMASASFLSERKVKNKVVGSEECDIEDNDLSMNYMGPDNLLKNDAIMSLKNESNNEDSLQKPNQSADLDSDFDEEFFAVPDDDEINSAI